MKVCGLRDVGLDMCGKGLRMLSRQDFIGGEELNQSLWTVKVWSCVAKDVSVRYVEKVWASVCMKSRSGSGGVRVETYEKRRFDV